MDIWEHLESSGANAMMRGRTKTQGNKDLEDEFLFFSPTLHVYFFALLFTTLVKDSCMLGVFRGNSG